MKRGAFITLEGIEGAGKSTLAVSLLARLKAWPVAAHLTREPGGTPLAERIRAVVLERGAESISPAGETLLMFAARSVHLENLVRPRLARGEWLICDRFTDATRAYQGAGRGVDRAWIESLAAQVHGDLEPDLTLLLDLPVALGLARAAARRGTADRIEAERSEFFERVRAGYLQLAAAHPQRIVVIDAARTVTEVGQAAGAALEQLLRARA
ncbi:MAG TPA: dTMP kinase [Steroidobacteraceae bacterium]